MNTLVGKSAPDFELEGVDRSGEFTKFCLSDKLREKDAKGGLVLFFYPLNFTFVCPTELVKLHEMYAKFQERSVALVGINTDSKFAHLAWRKQPVQDGGIGEVGYTLLSDYCKTVTKEYGVLSEEKGVAFRATFYIDSKGIVRYQAVNDLPIGRNIDEILRVVDAWKFHEKHGEVCPVNWKSGESGMEATEEGLRDYVNTNSVS